jgi:uncharacterized damage-inducible protein DinB
VNPPQKGDALSNVTFETPEETEFASFFRGYVELAAPDPVTMLDRQPETLRGALSELTDAEALRRYAPDKWSIKQVLGHMSDAERIFAYRLLRIARGDQTPLPGFDEVTFVAGADFDARSLVSLEEGFAGARRATKEVLQTISPSAFSRIGVSNGSPTSARALLFILVGHAEHHFRVLRDRYGVPLPS